MRQPGPAKRRFGCPLCGSLAPAALWLPRQAAALWCWQLSTPFIRFRFEYWITPDDDEYNKLMADVQEFVDMPGARDVMVKDVFSQEQFDDLKALMLTEGWEVAGTEARWNDDFQVKGRLGLSTDAWGWCGASGGGSPRAREAQWRSAYPAPPSPQSRHIISGFLKDASLGEKRLASMPDRVTNTINTGDQGVLCRPTVINCYDGDLGSSPKWWAQWKSFMFSKQLLLADGSTQTTRPVKMLQPIKRSKYPALTVEEEAMSLPLQTLSQAIFDSILVHIVNTVSPNGRYARVGIPHKAWFSRTERARPFPPRLRRRSTHTHTPSFADGRAFGKRCATRSTGTKTSARCPSWPRRTSTPTSSSCRSLPSPSRPRHGRPSATGSWWLGPTRSTLRVTKTRSC